MNMKKEHRVYEANDGKPFEIVVLEVTHSTYGLKAFATSIQHLDAAGQRMGRPLSIGGSGAASLDEAIEQGRLTGRQWMNQQAP